MLAQYSIFILFGPWLLYSLDSSYVRGYTLLYPWLGARIVWFLPSEQIRRTRIVALIFSRITFCTSLCLWASFDYSHTEPFQKVLSIQIGPGSYEPAGGGRSWKGIRSSSLEFGLDGLSLWMVLRTTALFPICILCSWLRPYGSVGSSGVPALRAGTPIRVVCTLLLILEGMLLAVWTILDIVFFYVLYESVRIPMFLRIGLAGSRTRKIRAAYQLVLYTLFGSLCLLPCLLLMYAETGTSSLELIYAYNWTFERQRILWWGFFFAFAVKIPMIPLHLWLPEAHVEASTAGSVLLAGVLLKLGSYGFLRFLLPLFPEATIFYGPRVYTRSLIARIYASRTTRRQVDLKKIIAYSSVAHMNLVTLSLFSNNELGRSAACFLMLSHGVVSPALFLCVGMLYDRHHTKLLKYLGGSAATMPLFTIFFFFFTLANMALPLSPSFIAEFLALCGVFAYHSWATVYALISVIRAAIYSLWAYARVAHGRPKNVYIKYVCDRCRREFWCIFPLLWITIWWGFFPSEVLYSLSGSMLLLQHLCL
uniref:NADH-ubiquinone oxidoreductase chain 4 n=1 Tax=Atractomorpha echinata TaxID=52677 RepID=A0A076YLJ8_9CHLO|nr:NADH dehydrogenase subunit 4 [Atractomorpha echinata]